MKASELRIGNLVNGPKQNAAYPVIEISELSVRIQFDNGNDWYGRDQLHGIPLTEEWLLKFGFEDHKVFDNLIGYKKNEVEIHVYEELFCLANNEYAKSLNYLHQLQNLYFALTGEELTIKETV